MKNTNKINYYEIPDSYRRMPRLEKFIAEHITQEDCDIWNNNNEELSGHLDFIFKTIHINEERRGKRGERIAYIFGSPEDLEFIVEVYESN